MALKVGELYVALTLNTSGFAKSLSQSLDGIAKVSKSVSKLSRDVGQLGTALAASMAGVTAVAAKFDANVNRAVSRVREQFDALSVEVGRSLVPAVNAVANALGNVVRVLRSMDPATRAQLASWAEMAAKVGVAGFVLSKTAGMFSNIMEIGSKLAGVLSGVFSAPFIASLAAVTAGLLGIVLLVGASRIAWREWGDDIKRVGDELAGVSDKFAALKRFLEDPFNVKIENSAMRREELQRDIQRHQLALVDVETRNARGELTREEYIAQSGEVRKNIGRAMRAFNDFAEGRDRHNPDSPASRLHAGENLGQARIGLDNVLKAVGEGLTETIKASGVGEIFDAITEKLKKVAGMFDGTGAVDPVEENFARFGFGVASPNVRPFEPLSDVVSQRAGSGYFGHTRTDDVDRLIRALEPARGIVGSAMNARDPGFGALASAAAQGGAAGGPVGAAAGVFAELLSRSTQFAEIMTIATEAFQAAADIVGQFLEPLRPLVLLARDLWVSLKPIVEISPAFQLLKIVLEPLVFLIRVLNTALVGVVNLLTGNGGFREAWESTGASLKGAVDGLNALAEGTAKATAEILNAPQGFRVAAYRYNAQTPEEMGGGPKTPTDPKGPATGGGGIFTPGGTGGAGNPADPKDSNPKGPSDPKGGTGLIEIHLHGPSLRDYRLDDVKGQYRKNATTIRTIPRFA